MGFCSGSGAVRSRGSLLHSYLGGKTRGRLKLELVSSNSHTSQEGRSWSFGVEGVMSSVFTHDQGASMALY